MVGMKVLARRLLDTERPALQKAVDLFEFQIATFRPRKKIRRHARKFAAMKLMEHLQDEHQLERSDIRAALNLSGYESLFSEAMSGGWLSLRKVPSDGAFDLRLAQRKEEAKIASDVINFLCEWQVRPPGKRASISKALFVVRGAAGRTDASRNWRRHAKNSVLIHLMFAKGFERLLPIEVATRGFAKKLLDQTNDIQSLRELVAARNRVLRILPELGEAKISREIWFAHVELPEEPITYDAPSAQTIAKLQEYEPGRE